MESEYTYYSDVTSAGDGTKIPLLENLDERSADQLFKEFMQKKTIILKEYQDRIERNETLIQSFQDRVKSQ